MTPADHHLAIEERIFRTVNVDGGAFLDGLGRLLSSPAFGACFAIGLAVVLWLRRPEGRWRWVLMLGLALAASDAIGSQVLRPLVPRMRPAYALPPGSVRFIAPAANVGSIPSLHAANFFAMALVGSLGLPRLAPALYAVATAVALSRIYVGVHWPGDVLLGALWGSAWAALSFTILRPRRAHDA